MRNDDHVLWEACGVSCVMVSCCAGAELQLRRGESNEYDVLLRELYPTKSDVYERAQALALEYAAVVGRSSTGSLSLVATEEVQKGGDDIRIELAG